MGILTAPFVVNAGGVESTRIVQGQETLLPDFWVFIARNVLYLVSTSFFLGLFYGMFIWMMSSGAVDEVEKGRSISMTSLIGLIISLVLLIFLKLTEGYLIRTLAI